MKIGSLDTDKKVVLIAEIGNNHEGDFSLAERLVHLAAQSGADVVKFQTIVPERLVTPDQEARIRQLKKYQFSYAQFEQLSRVAEQAGILFMTTPFDLESLRVMAPLMPAIKIASGDCSFLPLIEAAAQTGKPILFSTGAAELEEIRTNLQRIEQVWKKNHSQSAVAVLHCVMSYPTPAEEANLGAIETIRSLGVTAGYSDHTLGIDAAILSVALGARIIEKHFTISHTHSDFQDHKLSATPEEFSQMAKQVRLASTLCAGGGKKIQECEKNNRSRIRRSIVAARNLAAGTVLTLSDLTWLRPGDGLGPEQTPQVVGKTLTQAVTQGTKILQEQLA